MHSSSTETEHDVFAVCGSIITELHYWLSAVRIQSIEAICSIGLLRNARVDFYRSVCAVVCMYVFLSNAGIVSKRLNSGSRKQGDTIAEILIF